MKEVIATEKLEMDALTLHAFIEEHIVNDYDDAKTVVNVEDDEGRHFIRVSLVKETLSDGGHVFNLVLSD
jgi:hypothetical protein